MGKTAPIALIPSAAGAPSPASANPAVARCLAAQARTREENVEQGKNQIVSAYEAIKAYRNAMPPLSGYENIRDFIACVAHGMLIGTVDSADGARLLYAAQVATTTAHSHPARQKPAA